MKPTNQAPAKPEQKTKQVSAEEVPAKEKTAPVEKSVEVVKPEKKVVTLSANDQIKVSLRRPDFIAEVKMAMGGTTAQAERYIQGVTNTILMDKTGKLRTCSGGSILKAILSGAQVGLDIDNKGHAFLVPFYNKDLKVLESVFMPGYKGYIYKIRQSKSVTNVLINAVYKEDSFRAIGGSRPDIEHIPNVHGQFYGHDEHITHVYSIVKFANGELDYEIMTRGQADDIKKGLQTPSFIWADNFGEMAKKTVMRRHSKRLQLPELERLVVYEDTQDNDARDSQATHQIEESKLPKINDAIKALGWADDDFQGYVQKRFKKPWTALSGSEQEIVARELCKEAMV